MVSVKRKSEKAGFRAERPVKKQKPLPSVLREEEPAFPRGGASILTPLEQKQIQIQAKQDVLFEQSTGQKTARFDSDGEQDGDDGEVQGPVTASRPVQRKAVVPRRKSKLKKSIEERGLRIEGLSYKVSMLNWRPFHCTVLT